MFGFFEVICFKIYSLNLTQLATVCMLNVIWCVCMQRDAFWLSQWDYCLFRASDSALSSLLFVISRKPYLEN